MKSRSWFRPLALAVALGTVGTGCYGSFAATRTLHGWNGQITENEFVHTIMMWVFIIFPVYELFLLGDGIIFNVIEFWTGENPIASNEDPDASRTRMLAGVELTKEADGTVRVAHDGRRLEVRPVTDRSFEVRIDDTLVGTGRSLDDGGLVLFDAEGGLLRTLFPSELDQVQDALGLDPTGPSPIPGPRTFEVASAR